MTGESKIVSIHYVALHIIVGMYLCFGDYLTMSCTGSQGLKSSISYVWMQSS